MNKFERWIFRWLVRKHIWAGYGHQERIIWMYDQIRWETYDAFSEDSIRTTDSNLTELFNLSKQKDI